MVRIPGPQADNYSRVSLPQYNQTPTIVLPPLILHPFGTEKGTEQLLEGSRAAVALQQASESNPHYNDIQHRVILGRYQEIRMLLFLGKDIFRWIEQCLDHMERSGDAGLRTNAQCLASTVVETPPPAVRAKLESWGVSDRRAVFSRAIGIRCLFEEPPGIETLSPLFLEHYHRFADYAFICFQQMRPYKAAEANAFDFQIYASEEYSQILSAEWQSQ
jgi:hypothetical protein